MVDMNYSDLGLMDGLLVYVAWTYSSSGFYTCKRIWNRVVKTSRLSNDCMPHKLKSLETCDFFIGAMRCKWD
jgi:hypothetical protein